jgi:hypothetical protein
MILYDFCLLPANFVICLGCPSCLQDKSPAQTTQKAQPVCCCRGIFTVPLNNKGRNVDLIEYTVLLLLSACMLRALPTSGSLIRCQSVQLCAHNIDTRKNRRTVFYMWSALRPLLCCKHTSTTTERMYFLHCLCQGLFLEIIGAAQAAKTVMFSESCSEVSPILRRGVSAEIKINQDRTQDIYFSHRLRSPEAHLTVKSLY